MNSITEDSHSHALDGVDPDAPQGDQGTLQYQEVDK